MENVEHWQEVLANPESTVFQRYNCLGMLRTIGTEPAAKALELTYPTLGTSELLRHDVMYCMGQMRQPNSLQFLLAHLQDDQELPIVRHEACEALSNFFDIKDQILQHFDTELLKPNLPQILKSTLIVAKEKMISFSEESNFGKKYLGTIEPAEPFTLTEIKNLMTKFLGISENAEELSIPGKFWELVEKLVLMDLEKFGEYNKHRLAYFFRDQVDELTDKNKPIEMLELLICGKNRDVTTALLRHEVAFIFGQVYDHAQRSLKT